ncbi:hypothetical protein OROHE_026086 [Orobanche hederae]
MRSYKPVMLFRRFLHLKKSSYGCRRLSSLSSNPLVDDSDNLVVVEGKASSRTAILNRPSSLNALNTSMVARLQKLYKNWEDDPGIGFVVLKGGGRAFTAGGDIVSLYNMIRQGNLEACKEFFRTIYSFIYFLGTYLKPHVALLNGITMGGGAGISIPGTFRVATDKTIFATPETLIGFHPDAGASFYLSHLPGYLGEYLALTGEKLNGADMLSCGLATHFSQITKLPLVEEQLGNLVTDDPSIVETSLGNQGDSVHPHQTSVIHRNITFCHQRLSGDSPVAGGQRVMVVVTPAIETLDKCFSHDSVEEIIESLENEAAKTNDVWCLSTLKRLKEVAPLSLKVSLRSSEKTYNGVFHASGKTCNGDDFGISSDFVLHKKIVVGRIREGRFQTLDQCLAREYRMSLQGISGQITSDFCEGVRAKLIDKDFTPKWDPPSLQHVHEYMVDEYFTPLSAFEPELDLPIKQREAFT